jgi:hypothetical protein
MVLILGSIAKAAGEEWDEAEEYAGASTTLTRDLNSVACFGTFAGFGWCTKELRGRGK